MLIIVPKQNTFLQCRCLSHVPLIEKESGVNASDLSLVGKAYRTHGEKIIQQTTDVSALGLVLSFSYSCILTHTAEISSRVHPLVCKCTKFISTQMKRVNVEPQFRTRDSRLGEQGNVLLFQLQLLLQNDLRISHPTQNQEPQK
jgi:hypothetical protein